MTVVNSFLIFYGFCSYIKYFQCTQYEINRTQKRLSKVLICFNVVNFTFIKINGMMMNI